MYCHCRSKVYELLVNCIPADVIMKKLASVLVTDYARSLPESYKHEVFHWAAHYEHRLQMGQKELFHIEAFIARIMSVIKAGGSAPGASGGAGVGR